MVNRIGEFLVSIGAMAKDQVEDVLLRQRRGDTRIFGEIAIELGYLNDDAIKRYVDYLEAQKEGAGKAAV
jgi:hypothetical protein